MAGKARKAQQDQATDQAEVSSDNPEQTETANQEREAPAQASAKTKVAMVDAVLKTRHCRGGICKESGGTMPMTQGEYDRLKKFDRVE